jgi:hypothetical protein
MSTSMFQSSRIYYFLQIVIEKITESAKKIFRRIQKSSKKHKKVYEKMQLTTIYILGGLTLLYSLKAGIGKVPDFLYEILPFSRQILNSGIIEFFSSPEKIFLIYILITEYIINRPLFQFSLLIKFNILYIFILEMFQSLALLLWDLFFGREFTESSDPLIQLLVTMFFYLIFAVFFYLYGNAYFYGIQGYFPSSSNLFVQKLIDSVAFWLRVKRFPKKKA